MTLRDIWKFLPPKAVNSFRGLFVVLVGTPSARMARGVYDLLGMA